MEDIIDEKEKLNRRSMITFIDDDGKAEVMTRLLPIFKERKLKASCAIITSLIDVKNNVFEGGKSNFLTTENLNELYDEGWEMLGHDSYYLSNMNDFIDNDDLNEALNDKCKLFLESKGFKVRGFVYPQNLVSPIVYEKVKKYYDFAFGGMDIDNNEISDRYKLNRIAFGCYTGTNPCVLGNDEKKTLEYFKRCVDYCIENNMWLVFMMHCADKLDKSIYSNNDYAISNILPKLLDYIIEKGVEVVTPSEGYARTFNESIKIIEEVGIDKNGGNNSIEGLKEEIKNLNRKIKYCNYIEPYNIYLNVDYYNKTQCKVKAIIEPYDTTNKELWWSTSNPKIATVNQKGVVKGKKNGKVKIRATTISKGIYDECELIVKNNYIYINKLGKKSIIDKLDIIKRVIWDRLIINLRKLKRMIIRNK